MISEDLNFKLLDFGISKSSKNTLTTTQTMGTIIYMAPENFIIRNKSKDTYSNKSQISTKVDVWAYGCIFSEILSKNKPWNGLEDTRVLGMLYTKSKFQIPDVLVKDKKVVNIIKRACEPDYNKRINTENLYVLVLDLFYIKYAEYFRRRGNYSSGDLNLNLHDKKGISNDLFSDILKYLHEDYELKNDYKKK